MSRHRAKSPRLCVLSMLRPLHASVGRCPLPLTPASAGIVASSPAASERGGPGPAAVVVAPSLVVGESDGPGPDAEVAGSSPAEGERDGPGPVRLS
jgi:hypothetical protein